MSDTLPFDVRYILVGPQERALATDEDEDIVYPDAGQCTANLPEDRIAQEVTHGDVTIYVLD